MKSPLTQQAEKVYAELSHNDSVEKEPPIGN